MDMFAALADPTRRHIVEMLAVKGQLSASQISDKFRVSPPAISQHLKVLRQAKLVDMEKRGQQRMYQINPDTMQEFEKWVQHMEHIWNERFDLLDNVLKVKSARVRRKGKSYGRSK